MPCKILINQKFFEEASHKTVIVLDEVSVFSMDQQLIPEIKNEKGETISCSFAKTLWNYTVEAVLEFHRVIVDLFPFGNKQLRLVLSDFDEHFFSTPWKSQLIKYEEILKSLSHCSRSNPSFNSAESRRSTCVALKLAIEGISEKTLFQQKAFEQLISEFKVPLPFHKSVPKGKPVLTNPSFDATSTEYKSYFQNKGSIVVFTRLNSLEDFAELVENCEVLIKTIPQREKMLRIDQLNLIVINVLDCDKADDATFTKLKAARTTAIVNAILISAVAGSELISCMHYILQDIYDLTSTKISGIPMKHDAQSKNVEYSVELLHSKSAYTRLAADGFLESIFCSANHGMYCTARLKWSKTGSQNLDPLIFQESYAVTPVSIGNAVTNCLINYVQMGKVIMLEVENEGCAFEKRNLISHMLNQSSVTGQMMMQCIAFENLAFRKSMRSESKFAMADLDRLGISFASIFHLMACSALIPVPNFSVDQIFMSANDAQKDIQINGLRQNVERLTNHFVLCSSDSKIIGKPQFRNIFSILQKPVIEGKEFEYCKGFIRSFVASKNFQVADCGNAAEDLYRLEESFRSACDEFAKLLSNFAHISPVHERILNQLRRFAGVSSKKSCSPTTMKSQPSKVCHLQQNEGPVKKLPVNRKRDMAMESEAEKDCRPRAKREKNEHFIVTPSWLGDVNMLDYFNNLYEENLKSKSKSKEFFGREKYGENARCNLYPQLNVPALAVETGAQVQEKPPEKVK